MTSTLPDLDSIADAILQICCGVLPSPKMTSGKPWRSSRWWSTFAKSRSSNGRPFNSEIPESISVVPFLMLSSKALKRFSSILSLLLLMNYLLDPLYVRTNLDTLSPPPISVTYIDPSESTVIPCPLISVPCPGCSSIFHLDTKFPLSVQMLTPPCSPCSTQ